MRSLKYYGAMAGFILASFALDGCLREPVYREAPPDEGFASAPVVRVGISAALGVEAVAIEGDALVDGARVSNPVVRAPARIDPDGALLRFGGRAYRGSFEVLVRDGRLDLINLVPAEDYLAGVVGKEMSLSWPESALKAQVIAARTYALYEIQHASLRAAGLPFDIFDDPRSQVYAGTERESEEARRLVSETDGMVLRWEGKLIKAFYASTCGGATDPADRILHHPQKIPPLEGVTCGWCEGARFYRWEMPPMPIEEASARVGRGRLMSISTTSTLPSGRVETITIRTDEGVFTLDANDEFRRKIDPSKIRSTLWDECAVRDGALHVRGRGWGHGAGMCQMGALGLARAGRSAAEILAYYYPGAALEKIY